MPDNAELRKELADLRDKQRAGEDLALSERRRARELASASDEVLTARRNERGF